MHMYMVIILLVINTGRFFFQTLYRKRLLTLSVNMECFLSLQNYPTSVDIHSILAKAVEIAER